MRGKLVVLRDLGEERRFSMDFYADAVGAAAAAAGWAVRQVQPQLPQRHGTALLDLRVRRYIARYLTYPRRAAVERGDVLHVVDQSYAHLVRRLDPARTVVTCHDLIPLKIADGTLRGLPCPRTALTAFRWSVSHLPRAAAVVVGSEATRRDLLAALPVDPARVEVIGYGLERYFTLPSPQAVGEAARRLGVPREAPCIVHAGSTAPYKNFGTVLAVLDGLVHDRGLDVRLVRIGPRLDSRWWARARALHVADRIVEADVGRRDELPALYGLGRVLLFPSYYEGFGLPPVEAMACGVPVVTSDAPALLEVGGGAALSVRPGDVGGLVEAVACVLGSPELAAGMREKGLVRARRFAMERVAPRLVEVYRRIGGGGDEGKTRAGYGWSRIHRGEPRAALR